jgi:hypothetical protein
MEELLRLFREDFIIQAFKVYQGMSPSKQELAATHPEVIALLDDIMYTN